MLWNKNLEYSNLDKFLLVYVPEFQESYNEWADASNNWQLQHIVCMAFIEFLLKNKNLLKWDFLVRVRYFVDLLATSQDEKILDLLHSEIFEFIEDNTEFKILLSEKSEKLYYKNFK